VVELIDETARVRSIVLDPPDWPGHRAGQHVDVRVAIDDAHRPERSYSIASSPEDGYVVLTVERAENGSLSPYLVEKVQVGDELELRGPLGDSFVWDAPHDGPLLLVGEGAGVVPLRAILRHRSAVHSTVPVRLLYSACRLDEVIYRDELLRIAAFDEIDVRITLTEEQPDGWHGYAQRIDRALLDEAGWPPEARPLVYVAGPTHLVETAATIMLERGHARGRIRTEPFGRGRRPSISHSSTDMAP
jgi:ferredoxin-NADP reductase